MKPEFSIEGIKDHVISVHLTDESGTIDDVAEVCIDHGNENVEIPNKLNIALGYKETGIFPIGVYTVNEVTIQGPPKTLLIKAHATNLRISLKAKVSKEWRQITIENLVKEIAQKHGYGYKVAEEFKNVLIPHINQVDENDISLLTKIATEREAMAKLAGGYIILFQKTWQNQPQEKL